MNRGMTLIETLVAITILTVAIVAPMTLTVQSLSAAYYARDQIAAFHLAQEALEAIRAVRDSNILKIGYGIGDPGCVPMSILCNIPIDQNFIIDVRNNSITSCGTNPCPRIQSDTNLYGYGDGEPGWTDSVFRRTVHASYQPGSNGNEIILTVTVEGITSYGADQTLVTLTSNLHRWLDDGSTANTPGGG